MPGHSEGGLPRRGVVVSAERLARFLQGDIGGDQGAAHVRHANLLIAGGCGRAGRRGSDRPAGFVDGGCQVLDSPEGLGPLGFRYRRLRWQERSPGVATASRNQASELARTAANAAMVSRGMG